MTIGWVKPWLPSDTVDVPALEHFTLEWAAAAGLNAAPSVHHQIGEGLSVLQSCSDLSQWGEALAPVPGFRYCSRP